MVRPRLSCRRHRGLRAMEKAKVLTPAPVRMPRWATGPADPAHPASSDRAVAMHFWSRRYEASAHCVVCRPSALADTPASPPRRPGHRSDAKSGPGGLSGLDGRSPPQAGPPPPRTCPTGSQRRCGRRHREFRLHAGGPCTRGGPASSGLRGVNTRAPRPTGASPPPRSADGSARRFRVAVVDEGPDGATWTHMAEGDPRPEDGTRWARRVQVEKDRLRPSKC